MATGDESHYGPFRVIAWTLRIVGYLAIVVGAFGLTVGLSSGYYDQVPGLIGAIASGVIFVTLGEASFVLMDIEANTRPKS